MYDIKELTWEYHKNAERQQFVKVLMSGEIPEKLYAVFLYNQLQCYAALEKYAQENSLFRTTVGLQRAEHLLYDFNALWKDEEKPPIFDSTKEYIEHVKGIRDNPEKLYAHIYVRHMGDLKGGQMMKKKLPGPCRYHTFRNKEVIEFGRIIKETINSYMNVYQHSVLPEAIYCFESATKLFEEMNKVDPYIGTEMEGKD